MEEEFVTNFDGQELSLHEIKDVCEACDKHEISFDDAMGGDLANAVTIIRGLIQIIENNS